MDYTLEYRKAMFEVWVREQIDAWLHEYGAWDMWIEDPEDDFTEEDWEFIKDNLEVTKIEIGEKK